MNEYINNQAVQLTLGDQMEKLHSPSYFFSLSSQFSFFLYFLLSIFFLYFLLPFVDSFLLECLEKIEGSILVIRTELVKTGLFKSRFASCKWDLNSQCVIPDSNLPLLVHFFPSLKLLFSFSRVLFFFPGFFLSIKWPSNRGCIFVALVRLSLAHSLSLSLSKTILE